MLTTLKEWATVVSVALICAAVADMLAPDGKMQKAVKLCISLFLCAAMLTPVLKNYGESWGLPAAEAAGYDQAQVEQFQKAMEETLIQNACSLLSETVSQNIYHKIGVKVLINDMRGSVDEAGSFHADSLNVHIWASDAPKKQVIAALIQEELGEVAITFTEASGG